MEQKEKQLSAYIDQLNKGLRPKEHRKQGDDKDMDRLLETVRRVRLLREVEYPERDYPMQLASAVNKRVQDEAGNKTGVTGRKEVHMIRRVTFFATAAVAAAAIIWLAPRLPLPRENGNIVYAMERAIEKLEAYHGSITVIEKNEAGDTMTQAVREVWADQEGKYYVKELAGTAKDIITVNNGVQKWQLRPSEKTSFLFETFPDPYRFTFELAQELKEVKAATTVEEIGEEVVAGRNTVVLKITPKGGDSYRLWIDRETKLPLQKESAMKNAVQYLVTYTSIEFTLEIPEELLQYSLPNGFAEVDIAQEQVVNTIEEAENMIDFVPTVPDRLPEGYTLERMTVRKETNGLRLYYSSGNSDTVVVEQQAVEEDLKPASGAMLGKVNGNTAEVLINAGLQSIRWQEEGIRITVMGNQTFDGLMPFLEEMTDGAIELPTGLLLENGEAENVEGESSSSSEWKEPEVKVEVDRSVEENEQKSVDAGHSPWKLDPVFVAQVFASLLLSPEGIEGEYPISYEDIKIVKNDGRKAVVEIKSDNSIADYVYLERLIRQDETGIWTVTGYDKADSE
jgi:negative regulator of sigma E activity